MYHSYTTMVLKLASFLDWGEKQNGSHYHTYCKGCLKHYLTEEEAEAAESRIEILAEQLYLNGVWLKLISQFTITSNNTYILL